jgi:hypothetical protein
MAQQTKARLRYDEQWSRVLRWYGRVKKVSQGDEALKPSDAHEDDMYAFFLNRYHLKDWVKHDPLALQLKDRVEQFVKNSESLSICADLCNGLKHLSLRHSRRGAYFGPRIDRVIFKPDALVTRPGYLVIARAKGKKKSKKYDAFELATQCVTDWLTFFHLNRRQ